MTTPTLESAAAHATTYAVSMSCDSDEQLDHLAIRFYDRYDGVLVQRDNSYIATQFVEESSGMRAGRLAIQDMEAIGLRVRKIDRDLVDTGEVALRLSRSRQAVNYWADGKRRTNFPPPLGSPGGKRIWAWSQIFEWVNASIDLELAAPRPISLSDCSRLDVWIMGNRDSTSSLRTIGRPITRSDNAGIKGWYKSAGADLYQQVPENWLLEK